MKKLSFFLMAMLFSVMSFAAESLLVTLDFSKNTWGLPVGSANKTTATVNYTNGDYTITLAGGGSGHYYNNDGYLIFGKSGATLTLPAFDFKTTKIVVTGRTGASASVLQNIYVGATAVSTQTKGAAVTNTYAIAEDYQAAGNVYVLKVTSSHNTQIVKMEIYGEEGGEQGEKVDAPTFSVTETNFNKAFDLTISSAEGTTLKYTTDNTDPKTSETAVSVETNTANVAIPAKSTVVNAVAVKGDLVSVTSSIVYAYVNSAETAYTVAEAMEVIDAGLGLDNELYIKGIISKIESFNSQYGSITYWIEDEEGNEFECYSGLGLNKAKFTSKEDVEVGASVVACGVMKLFVTSSGDKIYEFNYNNYLVEYVAPVVSYVVTVSANPAEAGTVTGDGEYEEGKEATLTATPAEGYEFVNWTKGEEVVSTENPYKFTVTADVALVANFELIPPTKFTVTATAENGTVEGAGEYEEGTEVTLTATAAEGYEFVNWTSGETVVSTENPYKFTVTADLALVANFKEAEPEIESTWTVAGAPIFDAHWDPAAEKNDMTLQEDGTYKWEKSDLELAANASIEFKVVKDHDWGVAYPAQNYNLLIPEDGIYTVTITFNPESEEVAAVAIKTGDAEINVTISYVLMGVADDWTTGITLTQNPENVNEYVLLGQQINEGDAVKVVTLTDGVATAWCGNVDQWSVEHEQDDMDNIILAPGKYDFYFKVLDNLIYIGKTVEPEVPTALDNIDSTVAPVKAIVNGQLIIIKNGVQYNAQGAVVK